jgi:hypothetical protein
VSTRVISSPDDIPGGWYVIDDEVVRLQDAEFEKPKRGAPDSGQPAAIVAGSHRFDIGGEIQPAAGKALDDGFVRSVRGLWDFLSFLLPLVLGGAALFALDTSWIPWREDLGRQILVGAAACVPVVLLVRAALRRLTRRAGSRITRAMAGRLREDYDRQRGETPSPAVVR